MNIRETLKINDRGHLEIGGADVLDLAREFGTPLYVFDEKHFRDMCRVFNNTLRDNYGNGIVLYASKAFSCKGIYKILNAEGLGADVVSEGELYTALSAGFPPEKIYMHGNNKLPCELDYAISNKIGTIVIDAESEIDLIQQIAKDKGVVQDVLIRINPGVEAHTHHFIQTANLDSKFGFLIAGGAAFSIIEKILKMPNLHFKGLHSHIGSQIFEKKPFSLCVDILTDFIVEIKQKLDCEITELNLGGGFGIWYADGDKKMQLSDYADFLLTSIKTLDNAIKNKGIKKPFLVVEPGRSLVGEAGITLYTVGAIKDIKGVKKYVSVDGGMFDNPRFALYQAKYTPVLAKNPSAEKTEIVTIAGKCCESGDILCEDIKMPLLEPCDVIAMLSTGAYNYSMASNYNRNKIPPVVIVSGGNAEYLVKPQTNEDLTRNDIIPNYLK